jgi:hypothetical protein
MLITLFEMKLNSKILLQIRNRNCTLACNNTCLASRKNSAPRRVFDFITAYFSRYIFPAYSLNN